MTGVATYLLFAFCVVAGIILWMWPEIEFVLSNF